MLRKLSVLTIALCSIAGAAASTAAADTITAGNQIFSGKACFGGACADPEAYGSLPLRAKTGDTPGLSLVQTNASGYSPYNWDVAGNEANFFIRDASNGSQLVFRAFPGAKTDTLRANSNSTVSTKGVFVESNTNNQVASAPAVDDSGLLAAIDSVSFTTFTLTGDSTRHFQPTPSSFSNAFNLANDSSNTPGDVSAVALAGVQRLGSNVGALETDLEALSAKVNALPAPAAPTPDSTPGLAAANAQIAALTVANAKMLKSLAALQKKVKKLSKRK